MFTIAKPAATDHKKSCRVTATSSGTVVLHLNANRLTRTPKRNDSNNYSINNLHSTKQAIVACSIDNLEARRSKRFNSAATSSNQPQKRHRMRFKSRLIQSHAYHHVQPRFAQTYVLKSLNHGRLHLAYNKPCELQRIKSTASVPRNDRSRYTKTSTNCGFGGEKKVVDALMIKKDSRTSNDTRACDTRCLRLPHISTTSINLSCITTFPCLFDVTCF